MYTGTLIDDLMATVERAEQQLEAQETHEVRFVHRREATTYEMKSTGQNLLGVA